MEHYKLEGSRREFSECGNVVVLFSEIMKNRYIVIIVLCLFMLPAVLNAKIKETSPDDLIFRRIELGFRFMPILSSFKVKTLDGGSLQGPSTLGYGISGMLAVNITKRIGVQAEAIYSLLSQKYTDQSLHRTLHADYINVPVLLSITPLSFRRLRLNFVAGPQFGYNVRSSVITSGQTSLDSANTVLELKKNDLGLAYGAGFKIELNSSGTLRLDLGVRGVFGFMNIREEDGVNPQNFNVIDNNIMKTYAAYTGITFVF